MKAFIATAFALCYFLQDGVEGGHEIDFDWGNKRKDCLSKLGYVSNGEKDLDKVHSAFVVLRNAFLYVAEYDSAQLDKIFGIIGWKNDALTADQKVKLIRVVRHSWLQMFQNLIKDVRKQFEKAVQNDQDEYDRVWACIKSDDQGQANQQQNQTYLRLTQKGATCAENLIGKEPTEKLDKALHHYDTDLRFIEQVFGSNNVKRLLQSFKVSTSRKVLRRVLNNFQSSLFTTEEVRLATYSLPGQFDYVFRALQRLEEGLKEASKAKSANNTNRNGNGNKNGKKNQGNGRKNRGKPNKARAQQLVKCILKK